MAVPRASRRLVIDSSDEETSSDASRLGSSGESEWDSGGDEVEVELDQLMGGLRVGPSATTGRGEPSCGEPSCSDASPVSPGGGTRSKMDGRNKKTLMPHQRIGVDWLLSLYKIPSGGILADDMGLGKTFQVATFIHTLLQRGHAKRVLIVAPKTLLGAWENEVSKELEMELIIYGGTQRATNKRERQAIMDRIARHGGILMMTYGLIQRDADVVRTHELHDEDDGPFWDVLVMDEGHTLKNTGNKTRAEIEKVGARMRLLITGTPIQNNLMELHSLFDLVKEGLLGDKSEFKDTFEKPIKRGMSKEASRRSQDMGAMASLSLQKTYAPFMLRRTKEDVMGTRGGDDRGDGEGGQGHQNGSSWQKKDIVVWLRLTDVQLGLYRAFLRSKSVREVLNRNRSALASLTVLKKICKHPALLSDDLPDGVDGVEGLSGIGGVDKAAHGGGVGGAVDGDKDGQRRELMELRESAEWKLSEAKRSGDQRDAVSASCKTLFVMGLLEKLISTGHRTLVFSESKVMLNILENAIKDMGWRYLRIDGDVDGSERHARVNRFQEDGSYPVFLLTSQVGGLGITLTAADRVILCDPSWNPSVDNQSVDRACRLGQTRDVLVYRLVTCGTIEDKVYQKQVFKGAIFKAGTEQGEQQRYFSEQETQVVIMQDLFTSAPEEFRHSSTQKQLEARHRHQRNISEDMQREIDSLGTIESYVGFSDHDLLYSEVSAVSERIVDQAKVFQSSTTPQGKVHGKSYEGDAQLASMFDKALSLGTTSVPTAISEAEAQEATRTQLLADLSKQEKLLDNSALLSSLPDGGAKVRDTVAKLREQLKHMEAHRNEPRGGFDASSSDSSIEVVEKDAAPPSSPDRGKSRGTPSTNQSKSTADLLEVVQSTVTQPTPLPKGYQGNENAFTNQTTADQEQALVLRAKMKRAKAELHRKAKELEAYRLGSHVRLEEDAKLKADVERLLEQFVSAKTAWERVA